MPLDPQIAAAGVQTLSDTGNTIIGQIWAKKNMKRQLAANKELAKYTNEMNIANWERQNAYNTPAAQMQRYKEGGLNPNLIYGQGTPGNAGSLPNYSQPVTDVRMPSPTMNLGGTLEKYYDVKLKNAQIDNIKAATENKEQDTANKEIQAAINDIRRWILGETKYDLSATPGIKNLYYGWQTSKMEHDSRGARYQADMKKVESEFQRKIIDMNMKRLASAISNLDASTQLSLARKTGQIIENNFRPLMNDQELYKAKTSNDFLERKLAAEVYGLELGNKLMPWSTGAGIVSKTVGGLVNLFSPIKGFRKFAPLTPRVPAKTIYWK